MWSIYLFALILDKFAATLDNLKLIILVHNKTFALAITAVIFYLAG